MKTVFILLAAALLILGCTSARVSPTVQMPPAGYYRVGDPSLAPEESRAVSVAQDYLEKKAGKNIDAYYHPRKTNTGYSVDVNYLIKSEGGGQGGLTGPISSVRISADWQKVDYMRW